ncbi:prepilin peptidase [Virgibacillus salexigens]|uniref:prepilin peptidase n=1 Tax=Virgibacillus salexigens TaxID=61016 RepID=UPI003081205E
MDNYIIWFVFLIGTVVGSFLNVVGLRSPQQLSFTTSRSECPYCLKTLQWKDIIPILSFTLLKGKCRYCGVRISSLYPIMEIITGMLFVYCYIIIGIQFELFLALALVSMFVIVLVSDITYMIIPNKVLLFFLPIFVVFRIIDPLTPWWDTITGGVAGILIPMSIIIVIKGGMGGGDMKLFGLIGIVLGFKKLCFCFFLSCVIGAIIGIFLIALKLGRRNQPIPFAPYIIAASLITYFYGDSLILWYSNFYHIPFN